VDVLIRAGFTMERIQWQSMITDRPYPRRVEPSTQELMQRELAQSRDCGGHRKPRQLQTESRRQSRKSPPTRRREEGGVTCYKNRSRSGIRTRYREIENLELYQMSYSTIPCLRRGNPVRGTRLRDRRTAESTPPDDVRRKGRRWISLGTSLGCGDPESSRAVAENRLGNTARKTNKPRSGAPGEARGCGNGSRQSKGLTG
jgi:hypothetical protein